MDGLIVKPKWGTMILNGEKKMGNQGQKHQTQGKTLSDIQWYGHDLRGI